MPDAERLAGRQPSSLFTCPQCGSLAAHLVGEGKKGHYDFYACHAGCKQWFRGQSRDLTWQHMGHWMTHHEAAQSMTDDRIHVVESTPPPKKLLPAPIPLPWDRLNADGFVQQEN